jgi:hypothetical protein
MADGSSTAGLFGRPRLQIGATLFSGLLITLGVAGFLPGFTSNYGALEFGGTSSDAMLLGLFQVSILHNLVHLMVGLLGLALAGSYGGARVFLVGAGTVFLVLWLFGVLIAFPGPGNFLPCNTAGNWLHLVLGVTMIGAAALLVRQDAADDEARTGHRG